MIADYVEQLKSALRDTVVGDYPWLDWFVGSTIDLLTSPFTGLRTRSYWPELVCAVAIAAVVFLMRDRQPGQRFGAFLRYLFPRHVFIHQSAWVDCKLIIANHFLMPMVDITWRLAVPLLVGIFVGVLTSLFGAPPRLWLWSTTTIIAFTILWGLADDFGYYVFHYLSHRVPWLWAFHRVHHSAETLQVFANVRVHPVELLLTGPFKNGFPALVIAVAIYLGPGDAPFATIFGINLMAAFYGMVGSQLHHSHIWISWGRTLEHVLISPAMHHIHHSTDPKHWNRNMGGNFALWDWMFGTLYVPRGREELTFGLGGQEKQPHPTLLAAYLEPFWQIMPFRDWISRGLPTQVVRMVSGARQAMARGDRSSVPSHASGREGAD